MAKVKSAKKHVIGVDLGGTKIFTALMDKEGHILAEVKQATQAKEGPDKVIGRMTKSIKTVIGEAGISADQIRAVGVGSPGPLNPDTGVVFSTPNLPGWEQVPLAEILQKETGLPTFVENDVNAGTYGEFKLGAGQGAKDVVGIFVGTGIGGGLILGGTLRSGNRHLAGELGHVVLMVDGPLCGCGKRGCLEALASRTAITRDIVGAIRAGRKSVIPELAEGDLARITSGVLAKAVELGDGLALEVLRKTQYYLGVYIGSVVNFIDPEIIILGGGVVEAFGEGFLQPVREIACQYYISQVDADKVQIVPAKLGDYAGVLGAAMLAWERAKKAG